MKTIKTGLGFSRKNLIFSLLAIGALVTQLPVSVWATLPTIGGGNVTVVSGSATIPTVGTGTTGAMTITSTTANTVLSWQNFWDGSANGGGSTSADTITFTQPNSSSVLLNQA